MRDFREAKSMAKILRRSLTDRETYLSHSQCLELVAKQFGFDNWNMLAAKLEHPAGTETDLVLPQGWCIGGNDPEHYKLGVDPNGAEKAALIEHRNEKPRIDQFATLMQSIVANDYCGKRIRFKADLKTDDVVGVGTIWLRIDGTAVRGIKFDNMERRKSDGALTGTMDWRERQIVLDVPEVASSIHYGFFLRGAGRTWCRNVRLEEVGTEIPESETPRPKLERPTNLDFLDIAS